MLRLILVATAVLVAPAMVHLGYADTLQGASAEGGAPPRNYRIRQALAQIPGSPFDTAHSVQSTPGVAARASEALQQLLTRTPDWVPGAGNRRAAEKIRQLVDPNGYRKFTSDSIGGSNDAVKAFNRKRLYENPCFSQLAEHFYREIGQLDRASNACRPGLNQRCGAGPIGPVAAGSMKPGWLWDLALKRAGGDSGLAMALIGVCGHDDVGQGDITVVGEKVYSWDEVRGVIESEVAYYESRIEDLQKSKNKSEAFDIGQAIAVFKKKLLAVQNFAARVKSRELIVRETKGGVSCPVRNSLFFLPQSLGEEVDISQQLKDRVAQIQSPGRGPQALAAKHYHVYGGAFLACEGIQSGGHPQEVQEVTKNLAWTYRTARIQGTVQSGLQELDKEQKDYKRWKSDKSFEEWRKELGGAEGSARRASSERAWIEQDAAKVFDTMTIGMSIGGVSLHTNLQFPWEKNPVDQYLHEKSGKASPTKNSWGWSDERYEKARLKALTYLVDWEWTMAQHEAGAAFAVKHCKPRGAGFNDLDDVACKLLPSSTGVSACASGGMDSGVVSAVDQLLPAVEAAGQVSVK